MDQSFSVSIGANITGLEQGVANALRRLDALAQGTIRSSGQFGTAIDQNVNRSVMQLQRMGNAFTATVRQNNFGVLASQAGQAGGQVSSSLERAQASLLKLQQQIQNTTFRGLAVPDNIKAEYEALARRVSAAQASTRIQGPSVGGFSGLNQQLNDTRARMQDILAQGGRVPAALSSQFNGLERQVRTVNAQFERTRPLLDQISSMGSKLSSLGSSLSTYLTAPLVLAGGAAFKTYAQLDAMIQGFKVTSGSVAGANQEFREYYKLSQNPGLGFEEVEKAGLKFEALGYKSKEAQKDIGEIGNAIALGGGSKVDFQSVITQFTQMSSKAKVLGDDLKPILNSSPVIAKAINDMFGTTNSDDISKKLEMAGKSPKDFINELVTALSQLERAQAGPLNALENFGDALKVAGYEVGLAADKTFGLTDKVNGLGVFIGRIAEGFGHLHPAVQESILGLVSLAAAIGPLSLGLGAVMKILPILTSGFGALFSPVSLVIAGVVALGAAVYSIYSFNKAIQSSVDYTKMLADAHTSVTQAVGSETGRLNALLLVARDETQSKAARLKAMSDINALSPEYLGNLTLETINTNNATTALKNYTQAIRLKAQADYYANGLATAQANREKERAVPDKDRVNPLERIGEHVFSINGNYDEADKRIKQKQVDRRKQALADRDAEVKFYEDGLNTTIQMQAAVGIKPAPKPTITNYKDLGNEENALKDLRDHYKDLERQVGNYTAKHKEVPAALAADFKKTGEELKRAKAETKSLGGMVPDAKKEKSDLDVWKSVEEQLVADIQLLGKKATQAQYNQLQAVRNHIKELNDLTDADKVKARNDGSKPIETKESKLTVEQLRFKTVATFVSDGGLERYAKFAKSMEDRKLEILDVNSLKWYESEIERLKKLLSESSAKGLDLPPGTLERLDEYEAKVAKAKKAADAPEERAKKKATFDESLNDIPNMFGAVKTGLQKMADAPDPLGGDGLMEKANDLAKNFATAMKGVKETLMSSTIDALAGFGAAIASGTSVTEAGKNALGQVLQSFIGMLADQAIAMGKALLLIGIPMLLTPVSFAEGLQNTAAGAALVVAGGAVKALAGSIKFAEGGTVGGPVSAIIGEGRGTNKYTNPEWVSPVDKGSQLIAKNLASMGLISTSRPPNERPQPYQQGQRSIEVGGTLKASGSDLLVVIDRALESQNNFTGNNRRF